MGKSIDKLKKERYKASRRLNKSITQSLRDAGYTEATAHHSSTESVVKCGEQELIQEFKASDISVEWVVNKLTSELTKTDCKASDRIRVVELLGKWLNMFRDNNIQQTTIFLDPKAQEDARRVIDEAQTTLP